MKTQLLLLFILGSLAIGLQPPPVLAQEFPDVCQEPDNILQNCTFDQGLDHWQTFTEDGGANISVLQGGGECHAPLCPAAYIVTEGHFVGGLLQQVAVVTGNTYYANIVWLVFDSLANDASVNSVVGGIGRRIGVDPFGGTDSRSPNVVWSEDNWRNDCKICNIEDVTVTAQADTITVFLRLDDTWRVRAAEKGYAIPPSKDQFWIDDIGLKQVDGSAAPAPQPTEPPPTDTPPPPPTETSPPPAPTDTPSEPPTAESPQPAETPAELAQVETTAAQSDSPLPTPTAASTIAPPPTLTPSNTPPPTETPPPRPTVTRVARPTVLPQSNDPPALSAGLFGVVGSTICVGGVLLVMMGAVLAGLVWLYRLGWGKVEDNDYDDDDDDDFDDDEEIVVEIV